MFKSVGSLFDILKRFSFRSIPKTVFFNFKYFPLKVAVKLPVHVYYRVELKNLGGEIVLNSEIRSGIIGIGFPGQIEFPDKGSNSLWDVSGRVVFEGGAFLGAGSKIEVRSGGELIIGKNLMFVGGSTIRCRKRIAFGDNCGCSWECLFMDTDFHTIIDLNTSSVINEDREIIFGNNVWIGCRSTFLKGTNVGNYNVIAANSVLSRKVEGSNQIIGGNPARIIRENITWNP